MIHIMHDWETWSLKTNALPIWLGAVKFDAERIIDRIGMAIDPSDAKRYGFDIDPGTVMWWMEPEQREALDKWREEPKLPLWEALDAFSIWCAQTPVDQVGSLWGNGSMFDNVITNSCYDAIQLDRPFGHKGHECYRTLKNRAGDEVPFEDFGVAHTPVDDSHAQVLHLQKICARFGLKL